MSKKKKRHSGRKIYPQFIGKVQMTREGFAFINVEGEIDDIFVKASKMRGALHGDTVRVAVTKEGPAGKERGKRCEGEVIDIIERSRRPFVGFYHTIGAQAWVLMQSKTMPYDICVDAEKSAALGAEKGMKVAVVVDRWDRGENNPSGHIVDVLGMPGENDTEMHAILAEFNLPYRFEPEIEAAADAVSEKITRSQVKERRDFRDTLTFTIDPADAKDFDDAISFKALDNGRYEVGVHIADVSWYVRPGSPVDMEARARGTSVYLVDRTVPMLPEKLCNKLCSLRPGEDKLTFSAVFEMTADAKVLKTWMGRTVIRSDYRLDYDEAQTIIVPPSEPQAQNADFPEELRNALTALNAMARILKDRRFKEGAVDFDRPEIKVVCDENGHPTDVYERKSVEANWLIEEFMLLANRTVAGFVSGTGKTFVYRVHDQPDPVKLGGLKLFAKGFGYKMGEKTNGKAAAFEINALLNASKGKPEFSAFEDIALRSMAKAKYSTDNIGHYGLAFSDYTHFTSPIRRYPDLMVHRLLAQYLAKGRSCDKEYYEKECVYASQREQTASDAERASIKYKLVEYMSARISEEYDGHVSGLTEWGMYVEIEPSHIEGMVPLREIEDDWYEFDEKRYRLKGRRTHKIFRLGDKVRIRVKSANVEQRQLDFELI